MSPSADVRKIRAWPFVSTPVVVSILATATTAMSAWFLAAEKRIAGEWGFSLDDSWIYATMARNLATGHGFAFNPDEPVAGATGPLYTFVLAFFYFLFRDVLWPAKIFGVVCHFGAALALYATVEVLVPGRRALALFAGVLLATAPALVWASLSGMEISFYLLVVCIGLLFYVRGRFVAAVAAWAVGIWLRPDGLFLLALGLLGPPREIWKRVLVVAPIVIGFLAFNQAIGGHWMPQTVGMKAHFGIDLVHRTGSLVREWGALWGIPYRPTDDLEEPVLLLGLLAAGAAVTLRQRPLLALYVIGLPIALSLFREHSASHKRYILYVIPFGIALATTGLATISRRLRGGAGRALVLSLAIGCLVWQLAYAGRQADLHGWNVQNINAMQRALGHFAEKITRPGDRIATNDIGAIGYFSHRPVVDLMGLITPQEPLPKMLSKYKPELLVIFVDWFHEYALWDPDSEGFVFLDADSTHQYMIVGAIELRHNTISARDQMVAFRRLPAGAPAPDRLLMEVR